LSCGNEEQREHDSASQRLMTQVILVISYGFFGLAMITRVNMPKRWQNK
jgi:hypothetical protein